MYALLFECRGKKAKFFASAVYYFKSRRASLCGFYLLS